MYNTLATLYLQFTCFNTNKFTIHSILLMYVMYVPSCDAILYLSVPCDYISTKMLLIPLCILGVQSKK